MLDPFLSYIGCALSLSKLWVMGSGHIRLAFALSMISDPVWLYLGLSAGLPGQAILAVISFALNIRGLYKLRQQAQVAVKETT